MLLRNDCHVLTVAFGFLSAACDGALKVRL
jgi:hypothetical protein